MTGKLFCADCDSKMYYRRAGEHGKNLNFG
ncbi:hypothetical protein D3Z60_08180 [Lachnospiraceae bacterium]|nr:hypothetical protein [Lachnospiraceae bacterium]